MDVVYRGNNLHKIKAFLIFFCVLSFLIGCGNSKRPVTPILEYENGKVVRVLFKSDGNQTEFTVFDKARQDVPILGSFSKKNASICFTPALPFSKDQEFAIARNGKQFASFKVTSKEKIETPELVLIYPSQDTVPVNILKMYLEFSVPMEYVGNPLDFISVYDKTEDKEVSPFLELEAELWNKNRTQLTLWFDPGRIKTDLIPNQEKGLPLKQKHDYKITIDSSWKSSKGVPLKQSYSKTFHVIGKDMERPDPTNWNIEVPSKASKSPMLINFNETLDPILVLESIKIVREDNAIEGQFELVNQGKGVLFTPSHSWEAINYQILINPILEDLAGNNLKNLFDSDLKDEDLRDTIPTTIEFRISQ